MTVTKKLGTGAVLKYGVTINTYPTAPSSGAAMEYVKSINFSIDGSTVDATDNDSSGGWKEFLPASRSATLSFTCHFNSTLADADEQQKPITEIAETDGGDVQTFAYYPAGTDALQRIYWFSGFIAKITHNASFDQTQEITIDVMPTGPIYVGAVAS